MVGGVRGRGMCMARGACVVGGMHGRGGACMAVGVCGRGVCMHGRGACVAREMATEVRSMHPTGMHSCSF